MELILIIAAGIILALFILAYADVIIAVLALIAILTPPAVAAIYLATAGLAGGEVAGIAVSVLVIYGVAIVMGILARIADWP